MALTIKQNAFAPAYIETGNASEAYRRSYDAGNMAPHSIEVEACRLLQNPEVALRIEDLQAEHRKRHDITVDRILVELSKIGFANILDYMKVGPDAVVDLSTLTRDQAAAIQRSPSRITKTAAGMTRGTFDALSSSFSTSERH